MEKDLGRLLTEAMRDLNEPAVLHYSEQLASEGVSSFRIFEWLREGLQAVDARYEAGEYFIADLIMAGHIMKSVMSKVLVYKDFEEYNSFGRIVIATVRDDIHELGKSVIADVLRYNGFEVKDLGADVPSERIVAAVRADAPDILILSGTMKASPVRMAECVAALADAGLREKVRIIVGGASLTRQAAEEMGADAFSRDVGDCLRACHDFMALSAGDY